MRPNFLILSLTACLTIICLHGAFSPANGQTYKIPDNQRGRTLLSAARKLKDKYPDSALALYQQAFEESKSNNDRSVAKDALMGKGLVYCNMGQYAKSLEAYREVYPFCKEAGDSATSLLYNNIGLVYYNRANYPTAAYYYQLAIEEMEHAIRPSSLILITYSNLAAIFILFDQYDQALHYLQRAELIGRREQYKDDGLGYALINIGCLYLEQKKLEQAKSYFKEGLAIGEKYNNPDLVQTARINLGDILIHQKQPEKAITYFKEVLKTSAKTNVLYSTIYPRYALSGVYYQLGRYKEAEKVLLPALDLASKLGIEEGRIKAHERLSKVYKAEGKYKEALEQEQLFRQLSDSQLNLEKSKAINDLELKYRTAQKDRLLTQNKLQIAEQNSRLLRTNIIIWGVALTVLALAGVGWQRYRHARRLQRRRIQGLEQERELLEQRQELYVMQSMINGEEKERKRIGRELHDGIGGLLSVVRIRFSSLKKKHQELQNEEDFKEIVELLDEATGELRKTAHNLMPEALLKAGLLEAVKIFCERVRRGNDINLQVSSYGEAPELDPLLELSLYRIIQELVQNIIKHAAASMAQVQFNWKEESFTIMVEDNGVGMKEEDGDKGIGLENTMARMKALQGAMHIDSTVGVGTTVWLEFFREGLRVTQA